MLRFKNYLSEEVLPAAQVKDGSIDLEKPAVRGQINATLASVTAQSAVTPYIVLHKISKALAYFHIIMPRRAYLEGDKGVEVVELKQFGHRMGMTNDGQFVHDVPGRYFLFLSYRVSSSIGGGYGFAGDQLQSLGGSFKVTAKVVDEVELQSLLSAAEISLAENCDAYENEMKYKAMAPKEKMHTALGDCDCSQGDSPSTKSAVDTSMRKKDRKLSAASLDEDIELNEKRGLWDNIHAKRKRIKAGSGERMRKPGSEGAPTAADLRNSQNEEYALYRKGGSIGEGPKDHPVHGRLVSKHKTPEEAKSEAKALNKVLTPGEKKYYRMKYHVKPMKEETLDEAGYDKLDKYVRDAHVSGTGAAARGEIAMHRGQKTRLLRANKTGEKREQGINLALDKMAGRALIPARRKEKQIDEVSLAKAAKTARQRNIGAERDAHASPYDYSPHIDVLKRKAGKTLDRIERKHGSETANKISRKMGKDTDDVWRGKFDEGRMPASVIKYKQKLANMSSDELKKKFAGKTEQELKSMARRHGYGKDSDMYSKHVKEDTATTTGQKKLRVQQKTVVKKALGRDEPKKTILVTKKGDPRAAAGGGVRRIPKDKFDPSKYNLASE